MGSWIRSADTMQNDNRNPRAPFRLVAAFSLGGLMWLGAVILYNRSEGEQRRAWETYAGPLGIIALIFLGVFFAVLPWSRRQFRFAVFGYLLAMLSALFVCLGCVFVVMAIFGAACGNFRLQK